MSNAVGVFRHSRWWGIGARLVPIFLFLVHAYRVYGTDVALIDDTFIFFRYARHWAQGYGLVWNLGEPPVEGMSSLLYTALLAVGFRLGVEPVLWATLWNMAFALATFGLVARLGQMLCPFRGQHDLRAVFCVAGPLLVLAASPDLAFWVGTGMDTMLFTFLLVGSVVLTVRAWQSGEGWAWVGASFALLGMARLDSLPLFAFTLVVVGSALWRREGAFGRARSVVTRMMGVFFLLFVPFFLARWAYFGYLLPNSYYAKMGVGWPTWREGVLYLWTFFRQPGVVVATVLALVAVVAHRRWEVAYVATVGALLLARVVAAGGDWMPRFRMMVPLWPLLAVLSALGLGVVWVYVASGWRVPRSSRGRVYGALAMSLLLALVVAVPSLRYLAKRPYRLWRPLRLVEPMHAPQYAMGLTLREYLCPDDTLALIAVGAAAYLNDEHRVIDVLGLNDVRIAHSPPILYRGEWDSGHVRLDIDYVLAQNPEWIQLDAHVFPEPTFEVREWMPPQVIWGHPQVRERYEFFPLKVVIPTGLPRPRVGYIFFLHRKDAPHCGPGTQ